MFPKGTIYQAEKSDNHGNVRIALSRAVRLVYHVARISGAALLAFSFLVALFTYGPIVKEEIRYYLKGANNKVVLETYIDTAEADRINEIRVESQDLGINSYFSIYIPKIEAASNVIPNVDTQVEGEYQIALKQGVAHAKGTFFPGQARNIFLFAHSTDSPENIARYNAVFYLLKKLEPTDKIIVFFADEKYVYEVENKVVVGPDNISYITADYGGERLILQTCDPPGTSWNRLLVIAKPWKS